LESLFRRRDGVGGLWHLDIGQGFLVGFVTACFAFASLVLAWEEEARLD
jgi:hypothetical protein